MNTQTTKLRVGRTHGPRLYIPTLAFAMLLTYAVCNSILWADYTLPVIKKAMFCAVLAALIAPWAWHAVKHRFDRY